MENQDLITQFSIFNFFIFQLISGSNRHRKSVLNRNRHQTHNRGNRHICANVSFPILHQ